MFLSCFSSNCTTMSSFVEQEYGAATLENSILQNTCFMEEFLMAAASFFMIKKFSFIIVTSIEWKNFCIYWKKPHTRLFLSKVEVLLLSNKSPGFGPKLAVTYSICSQRLCLRHVATYFSDFS